MARSATARRPRPNFSLEGLPLSETATRFARRHPDEARKLMAAALEAAAARKKPKQMSGGARIPDALKPFVVHGDPSAETITISEAASRLKISRTTAYDWIEKKRMIGWKGTKAGVSIPAKQILGPGEIAPGIDRVLDIIEDPRTAWRFLSEESTFFDEPTRPIDALVKGRVEDVLSAAEAYGEAFT